MCLNLLEDNLEEMFQLEEVQILSLESTVTLTGMAGLLFH